ncbi:MAG: exosortase C-terminal domain/associated protein EpsI [Edaphobacter sp.]
MKSIRFWVIVVLLISTIFVLESRGDVDRVPPSEPLSLMPRNFGSWTARDVPLTDDTLEVLGKGDFLNRVYTSSPADNGTLVPPVSLFIGYFASQRTGQTMHSPQNCLPGAGWSFESKKYTEIRDINGKTYNVGEYVISNGEVRQLVMYWYQAHGRSIPNEYAAKGHMVLDAIRTNRTDGALVRVITPMMPGEPAQAAEARVLQFTQQMAPNLPRFIPN